jgi:hypothetical protein
MDAQNCDRQTDKSLRCMGLVSVTPRGNSWDGASVRACVSPLCVHMSTWQEGEVTLQCWRAVEGGITVYKVANVPDKMLLTNPRAFGRESDGPKYIFRRISPSPHLRIKCLQFRENHWYNNNYLVCAIESGVQSPSAFLSARFISHCMYLESRHTSCADETLLFNSITRAFFPVLFSLVMPASYIIRSSPGFFLK